MKRRNAARGSFPPLKKLTEAQREVANRHTLEVHGTECPCAWCAVAKSYFAAKKQKAAQPIERTEHGENIGDQIYQDAYGKSGTLTAADVWYILDQIHTNLMDKDDKLADLVQGFYQEVARKFNCETV